MHIYAFGSICRGEVVPGSDVDLLALVDAFDPRFDSAAYSVYSYSRLRRLWSEGNPFAWHLHRESRLLFAEDDRDFIGELGSPAPYARCVEDCENFRRLFFEATEALAVSHDTAIFELSTVFLAIRNIATCFSLGAGRSPVFSRHAALKIGAYSLDLDSKTYGILETARTLCTRAHGPRPSDEEIAYAASSLGRVGPWMDRLVAKARSK